MTTERRAASSSTSARQSQAGTLGSFIRMQRQLAQLSLRELAELTTVSNAYLSQIERDLHQPSLKVLRSIADALGIPPSDLLDQAEPTSSDPKEAPGGRKPQAAGHSDTVRAIKTDPNLSQAQREALLAVYRSFDTNQ